MAEVTVPEEFLFDVGKSMEDLALSQREISRSVESFNRTLNQISDVNQSLNSTMSGFSSESLIPRDLLDGINNLTGTIQKQTKSNEESSREIFDVLRPQPTTSPISPSTIADLFSGIPRFEEGGEMQKSGAAIVGESGPELLLIPEGSQVAPLDASLFDKFDVFLNNLDPSGYMKEFLGSQKVLVASTPDGYQILPGSSESIFQPFDITQKIKERSESEEAIFNNYRLPIIERRKSSDAIQLLDRLESEVLPFLNFLEREDYIKSLNPPALPQNEISSTLETDLPESVSQITAPSLSIGNQTETNIESIPQIATPNLSAVVQKTEETPLTGTGSFLGQSLSALSSPGEQETQTESSLVSTSGEQISQLTVQSSELSRPTPPPTPAPSQNPPIETVTVREVVVPEKSSPSNLSIPQNLSVTVTKDENTENLLKEMNTSLNRMNELLFQMSGSLSKSFISPDSYPIRPSNKNF